MTVQLAIAWFLTFFPITISPGPANVLLSSTAAQFGTRRTLPLMWGIVAVFSAQIAVVAIGVGEALLRYPRLFFVFRIGGSLYLFYLAYKFFRSSGIQSSGETKLGFREGAVLQFFNFKALTVPLIMYTQFLDPGDSNALANDNPDGRIIWVNYRQPFSLGRGWKPVASVVSIKAWPKVARKSIWYCASHSGSLDIDSIKGFFMEITTKIAIVVADDMAMWQKFNVVAFLTSGVMSATDNIIGEPYEDATGKQYNALCVQPIVVLKTSRAKLSTFLARAERRSVAAAIYIEDMFATGHDAANRETVKGYVSADLPLVGIAIRAERKEVDKIFKGAKLHE